MIPRASLRLLPALRSSTRVSVYSIRATKRFSTANAENPKVWDPALPDFLQTTRTPLTYDSTDTPFLVGSAIIFGGLGLYLLSPSGPNNKKSDHSHDHGSAHESHKVEMTDVDVKVEDTTSSVEAVDVPSPDQASQTEEAPVDNLGDNTVAAPSGNEAK